MKVHFPNVIPHESQVARTHGQSFQDGHTCPTQVRGKLVQAIYHDHLLWPELGGFVWTYIKAYTQRIEDNPEAAEHGPRPSFYWREVPSLFGSGPHLTSPDSVDSKVIEIGVRGPIVFQVVGDTPQTQSWSLTDYGV